MNELPAAIQRIVDKHQAAPRQRGPRPIRHTVDFDFDMQPGTVTVARMQATSALPVPVVGQQITVYGIPVRVADVDTYYEIGDGGECEVLTAIRITPED